MKKILTILLVIILLGAAIGGFFIYRHASTTIGREAAIEAALADAGLTRSGAYDIDVDYEHGYYEVSFESEPARFSLQGRTEPHLSQIFYTVQTFPFLFIFLKKSPGEPVCGLSGDFFCLLCKDS